MPKIHSPHDTFFKETFSHLKVVLDFLQNNLTPDLLKYLWLESIAFFKDSFIDHKHKPKFTDMLFTVQTRSKDNILFLFEHKSKREYCAAFYVTRYIFQVWGLELMNRRRSTPDRKPLHSVVTIMFYNGTSKWTAPLEMQGLVQNAESCKEFVPQCRYLLYDLSQIPDEEIRGGEHLRMALLVMKYINRPELKEKLNIIFPLLYKLGKKRDIQDILDSVVTYMMSTKVHIRYEDIAQAIEEHLVKPGVAKMPTLAQQFIEKGIEIGVEKGIEKGIEKGRIKRSRELIVLLLKSRFGSINQRVLKRLNKIEDLKVLDNLFKQCASASTIDEVLAHFDQV